MQQPCTEHDIAIKELQRKVENLDNMREIASKLSVLMEVTIEGNRQRDEVIKQQSQTLTCINENLSALNYEIRIINTKVDTLEQKVKLREEEGNINVMEVYKEITKYILVGGIGGAIVTLLFKTFE